LKLLFIIPARGGSKRLPGKNIKSLMGKPLLAYSIEFAQQHIEFQSDIVVSTDDTAIKKIALDNGALVIERPIIFSGDLVPTIDVMIHVLSSFKNVDWVVLLQPTNPLRPQNLLRDALKILETDNYDSLMTVTENLQKFGRIKENTFVPYNYTLGQRSQDMEPLYFENGLLYISKPKIILEGKLLGNHAYPMIVNHPFAHVDIDTLEDFEYAEYLAKKYNYNQ